MNEGSGLKPAPLWLFVAFCGVLWGFERDFAEIDGDRKE